MRMGKDKMKNVNRRKSKMAYAIAIFPCRYPHRRAGNFFNSEKVTKTPGTDFAALVHLRSVAAESGLK